MDSSLELATRVNLDSEHKSLYSWFIEEVQEDGEKLPSKWIPWNWSLYFRAKSLQRIAGVGRDGYSETPGIADKDFIKCSLDSVDGEFRRPVSYSMLGTKRRVQVLTLQIHRLAEGDGEERCTAGGNVEWVYKEEFSSHSEIVPDELYITVHVKPERYERLLDALGEGPDTELTLMIGGVSGFYSHWSPDIKTSSIKILTTRDYGQRPIELPEGKTFEPPALGEVRQFNVSVVRTMRPEAEPVPEPDYDYEEQPAAPPPPPWAAWGMAIAQRLDQVKYTLWVLIAATILLLIFRR
jgi:hypothetical protein